MSMNELRKAILHVLDQKEISLSKFASEAGVEQASLWRFLYGNAGLSGENTLKLLRYCRLDPVAAEKALEDGE